MKPDLRHLIDKRFAAKRRFRQDLYWLISVYYPQLLERGRGYAVPAYTEEIELPEQKRR